MGLNTNGSLYPWLAPFVFAMVSAGLFASGHYAGGLVTALIAIVIRWLHQIAIDRGER